MTTRLIPLLILILMVTACSSASNNTPSGTPTERPTFTGVEFPDDFPNGFVQYATVDRKDGIQRNLYINTESLNALRNGRLPFPNNSTIVIEGFQVEEENGNFLTDDNGRFIPIETGQVEMFHVAQKRNNWQDADFISTARSGNWNFGSFFVESLEPFPEDMNACFNCHNTARQNDFIYSTPEIFRFTQNDIIQYVYCNQTGRSLCE